MTLKWHQILYAIKLRVSMDELRRVHGQIWHDMNLEYMDSDWNNLKHFIAV